MGWLMLRWQDFSPFCRGYRYSERFQPDSAQAWQPDSGGDVIGAYAPRAFMKSVLSNPEEAVRVFEDLGAEFGLGIHWAHKLTLEKMDERPARLQAA